jgi:hypothetical protein
LDAMVDNLRGVCNQHHGYSAQNDERTGPVAEDREKSLLTSAGRVDQKFPVITKLTTPLLINYAITDFDWHSGARITWRFP